MVDEMDFGSLGEKKKAIFCVIPVDDSSMNYLVGMLYTQCFQALYRRADEKHNGRLPVPVRVIQDEWANVAQPESYPKILATCRSYNIGLNIIGDVGFLASIPLWLVTLLAFIMILTVYGRFLRFICTPHCPRWHWLPLPERGLPTLARRSSCIFPPDQYQHKKPYPLL